MSAAEFPPPSDFATWGRYLSEGYRWVAPPGREAEMLFGQWLLAKNGGAGLQGGKGSSEIEEAIKRLGCRIINEPWPHLNHWYADEIRVGQRFVWEPLKPDCCGLIEVIKIEERLNDDRAILTKSLVTSEAYQWPKPLTRTWNDESRFREAVYPVAPQGSPR